MTFSPGQRMRFTPSPVHGDFVGPSVDVSDYYGQSVEIVRVEIGTTDTLYHVLTRDTLYHVLTQDGTRVPAWEDELESEN